MSDTSQGPGWWQSSDGRWYPPSKIVATPRHHPFHQRLDNWLTFRSSIRWGR